MQGLQQVGCISLCVVAAAAVVFMTASAACCELGGGLLGSFLVWCIVLLGAGVKPCVLHKACVRVLSVLPF